MRRAVFIAALALSACAHQPPDEAAPVASLAPRYPTWTEALTTTARDEFPSRSFGWQIDSPPESEPLAGDATLETVTISGHGRTVDLEIILFDSRSVTLAVLDQPQKGFGGGRLTECMRAVNAIAGVNGGFFTADFTPMGLMIADGRSTGSWQANKLLTGSVVVQHGEPHLLWNAEVRDPSSADALLQAGPRLVDNARPVSGLERSKHVPRTFIATDGDHRWAFGLARNTSLAELAEILATPGMLPGFRIHRALNLDGGRSSALYYHAADGHEHAHPGWSSVRNYLAILPR